MQCGGFTIEIVWLKVWGNFLICWCGLQVCWGVFLDGAVQFAKGLVVKHAFNNDIEWLKVWGNFFICWCGLLFLSCARGVA